MSVNISCMWLMVMRALTGGDEGLRVLNVLSAAAISQKTLGRVSLVSYETLFKDVFIHESSYVDEGTTIGEGTEFGTPPHFTEL